jgi:hypothetical protein
MPPVQTPCTCRPRLGWPASVFCALTHDHVSSSHIGAAGPRFFFARRFDRVHFARHSSAVGPALTVRPCPYSRSIKQLCPPFPVGTLAASWTGGARTKGCRQRHPAQSSREVVPRSRRDSPKPDPDGVSRSPFDPWLGGVGHRRE